MLPSQEESGTDSRNAWTVSCPAGGSRGRGVGREDQVDLQRALRERSLRRPGRELHQRDQAERDLSRRRRVPGKRERPSLGRAHARPPAFRQRPRHPAHGGLFPRPEDLHPPGNRTHRPDRGRPALRRLAVREQRPQQQERPTPRQHGSPAGRGGPGRPGRAGPEHRAQAARHPPGRGLGPPALQRTGRGLYLRAQGAACLSPHRQVGRGLHSPRRRGGGQRLHLRQRGGRGPLGLQPTGGFRYLIPTSTLCPSSGGI